MRAPVLGLLLVACQTPAPPPEPEVPQVVRIQGEALGTTWSVSWLETPELDAEQGRVVVSDVLAQVDEHMSTWRDDSELSRARRASGPAPISQDTALVVDAALDLAAVTGGAFDPTVQPLMELWGFFGTRRDELPTEQEIAAVRERVGWQKVVLAHGSAGPTLDVAGTALDLSAIAKGHAVDRIHNALAARGASSLFVEVGGEVRVSGPASQRPEWRVGVSVPDPESPPDAFALVVSLTNGAVATSGNYRNHYQVDGQVLVHTMDPRVGKPVTTNVASATVVAPDCRTADGLATSLMVLPADQGLALIESLPDVDASLLLFEGERFRLRSTSGMSRHVQVVSDRVDASE